MLLRQLFDPRSSTYTYLLADEGTRDAVLIDPVFEQLGRDVALIRELGLTLRYTIDTHVHADHVTAAWLCKQELGSQIVVSAQAGAEGVDVPVHHGDVLRFGACALEARATPGHTDGCTSYVTADHRAVFTGDALLIRAAGRTDFQHGDARTLYRSVHGQLFTLPADCTIYPGHDYQGRTVTSVAEEREHNPRLGGERSEDDFVGTMDNLGLAHPKLLAVALPANLRCGRPEHPLPEVARWAPVMRSYAGVPQLEPEWLDEHRDAALVLDVREPHEFNGELGHIRDARLIPMGDLRAQLDALPRDRPIVVVCRSGGRSAQASLILEGAGFPEVANLAGGMIRWRSLGLPVA